MATVAPELVASATAVGSPNKGSAVADVIEDFSNAIAPEGIPADCGDGNHQENGVSYFSWSGTGGITTLINPSDISMAATSLMFKEANDGMVGKCSSHLGKVIRDDYNQNHLNEVNQVLGLVDPFSVNPVELYRQHANRLKGIGL